MAEGVCHADTALTCSYFVGAKTAHRPFYYKKISGRIFPPRDAFALLCFAAYYVLRVYGIADIRAIYDGLDKWGVVRYTSYITIFLGTFYG
jgi:hypothetical protein